MGECSRNGPDGFRDATPGSTGEQKKKKNARPVGRRKELFERNQFPRTTLTMKATANAPGLTVFRIISGNAVNTRTRWCRGNYTRDSRENDCQGARSGRSPSTEHASPTRLDPWRSSSSGPGSFFKGLSFRSSFRSFLYMSSTLRV